MKNYMEQIVEMLGVQPNEEFEVVIPEEKNHKPVRYQFNSCQFGYWETEGGNSGFHTHWDLLLMILCGQAYIKKLPWQPKEYEHYYGYTRSSGGGVYLYEFCWKGTHVDIFNYRHGFCYKTREEAAQEANMKRARKFFNSYDIIDWE